MLNDKDIASLLRTGTQIMPGCICFTKFTSRCDMALLQDILNRCIERLEIVKCGECVYWCGGCSYHADINEEAEPMFMKSDDYCNYGRREGTGNNEANRCRYPV